MTPADDLSELPPDPCSPPERIEASLSVSQRPAALPLDQLSLKFPDGTSAFGNEETLAYPARPGTRYSQPDIPGQERSAKPRIAQEDYI